MVDRRSVYLRRLAVAARRYRLCRKNESMPQRARVGKLAVVVVQGAARV